MLLAKLLEIFASEVEGIKDAADIVPSLILQPITKPMISHFGKNGGNALGIIESDGPLIRTIEPSPFPNQFRLTPNKLNSHEPVDYVVIRRRRCPNICHHRPHH